MKNMNIHIKNKIYLKKTDCVYNNWVPRIFVNNLLVNGNKRRVEKILWFVTTLHGFLFLVNPAFLYWDAISTVFVESKLIEKRIRKKRERIPLLLSLLSNLKTTVKLLVSASQKQANFMAAELVYLVSLIQTIGYLSTVNSAFMIYSKAICLQKKYSHYRW